MGALAHADAVGQHVAHRVLVQVPYNRTLACKPGVGKGARSYAAKGRQRKAYALRCGLQVWACCMYIRVEGVPSEQWKPSRCGHQHS